jgi:pteridine reductase
METVKVALVTGSGRQRIGSVVAQCLAEAGYALAVHYHHSADQARRFVEQLVSDGFTAAAFQADVADEESVNSLFDSVLECFGRLDVLVTTSSIWDSQRLESVTAADVRRHFDVNALGTFLCARRAGLIMTVQPQGGSIITIGDWAIARPYRDHAAYFVSKGAIPVLTRVLAVELALRNPRVRVNCIHPGPVMFPPGTSAEERHAMIESTLVKDADCPETIGQTVLFLVNNPFVTGICLPVDGGRSIFACEIEQRECTI